jgi:hypothetical protein
MNKIEIEDGTPLLHKIMAHFGWYKVKKVDIDVQNLEVHYMFHIKDDETELPVAKPALKKAPRKRTPRSNFKFGEDKKNAK